MRVANQVVNGAEACILPVLGPPDVQPTILRVCRYLLETFRGLGYPKRICKGYDWDMGRMGYESDKLSTKTLRNLCWFSLNDSYSTAFLFILAPLLRQFSC